MICSAGIRCKRGYISPPISYEPGQGEGNGEGCEARLVDGDGEDKNDVRN